LVFENDIPIYYTQNPCPGCKEFRNNVKKVSSDPEVWGLKG